jgi:hypothetical protein
MKKILLVFLFIAVLATGSVFADHPSGWGLGVLAKWSGYGYYDHWGYYHGDRSGSLAFALKAPPIPIYWGINMALYNNMFSLGVQGDYYFIDKKMIPAANLHWYLGVGFFGTFYNHTWGNDRDYSWNSLRIGARIPVGISFQPTQWFEVFTNFAPSIGIHIDFEGKTGNGYVYQKGQFYPAVELFPLEIGVRFWIK